MKHTCAIKNFGYTINGKDLLTRTTGKFYTPPSIADRLADSVVAHLSRNGTLKISIIDPFCGDGRLVVSFLNAFHKANELRHAECDFLISIWDHNAAAVNEARDNVERALTELKFNGDISYHAGDSFARVKDNSEQFSVVITNPPWETIKPDKRELIGLSEEVKVEFINGLRAYDKLLEKHFPYSQPTAKFAGWGTNLSRCGLELSMRLMAVGGVCGIVLPYSLLMDQTSTRLRQLLLQSSILLDVAHYPAECRLFDMVDQEVTTLLFKKQAPPKTYKAELSEFNREMHQMKTTFSVREKVLLDVDYCIPVLFDSQLLTMLNKWRALPKIADLENSTENPLRLGRELDETDFKSFVGEEGSVRFVKGRMIERYRLLSEEITYVDEKMKKIPTSVSRHRIGWRDVSRRSQSRRMIAALIPPRSVTGNSLGIAYFEKDNLKMLRGLLAIFNSIPFEYQIISQLGTGHLSLGVIRKVHVPEIGDAALMGLLSDILVDLEKGDINAETTLEVFVAIAYGLTRAEYKKILNHFTGLPRWFVLQLLYHPAWSLLEARNVVNLGSEAFYHKLLLLTKPLIPNHYSARLSELDLMVAKAVRPGGNWKDIPDTVPSRRLVNIRQAYDDGLGSRSTYYGRLSPNKPAYTINTYFGRPGNGCHLHYDYHGGQHRVISQREAARLQSFPDSFIFLGSRADISTQIGNAVPPLLAYVIAKSLGSAGQFIDLFCGAGGLGLGFKWAGWQPIVSNDVVQSFLATYSQNVHKNVIEGDIRNDVIRNQIIGEAKNARRRRPDLPLFIIGGPPCQGFSTAGNYRTMDDERNKLFYSFKSILQKVKPDGFLFENVTGLLNMQQGRIFALIKQELASTVSAVTNWVLKAENFAIPQRRNRVFILGTATKEHSISIPDILTSSEGLTLFDEKKNVITVFEALSDLPKLHHGEDGSNKDYVKPSQNIYQEFMRGKISVEKYLSTIRSQKR